MPDTIIAYGHVVQVVLKHVLSLCYHPHQSNIGQVVNQPPSSNIQMAATKSDLLQHLCVDDARR